MTDTTRADFEAFIIPKILADYDLGQSMRRFENGDYKNDWIQVAWRSFAAGAQAAAACADAIRMPPTGTGGNV